MAGANSSTSNANSLGDCQVTLAQFDTVYEVLYSATDVAEVPEFVVQPRGMTALLDATGKFITEIGEQLSVLPEDERPGQVICLIMTDGMENSSKEWSLEAVRKLTKQQQDEWGWTFIFLEPTWMPSRSVGRWASPERPPSPTTTLIMWPTVGAMRVAREMVSSTRAGRSAAFSDEDRDAAMGRSRKSKH